MTSMTYPEPSAQESMVTEALSSYLGNPEHLGDIRSQLEDLVPADQVANMEAALRGTKGRSYRDGVLIQLAGKLRTPSLDATKRPAGARSLARRLGVFFKQHHIPAVDDAYQNIAKNSPELCRGNFPEWDRFLRWVNEASARQLETCFRYACAQVASEARPVPPMPELDSTQLTFARSMEIVGALLSEGSQGVFEQYVIAGLLHALFAYGNPTHFVRTKRVNASDSSSDAAGDIELVVGNRLLEAIEVTAADWRDKLPTLSRKIRQHDLGRIHVVAPLGGAGYGVVTGELLGEQQDVSILDLVSTAAVLMAALTKVNRKVAFNRMYEYLERYEGDVRKVTGFVEVLADKGPVIGTAEKGGQ